MGSLSSSAKSPQPSPQVVYVPQPTTTSTPIDNQPAEPTAEEQAAENRKKVLLRRNRGRFGTIATGLQGFLNDNLSNAKKTLLGE